MCLIAKSCVQTNGGAFSRRQNENGQRASSSSLYSQAAPLNFLQTMNLLLWSNVVWCLSTAPVQPGQRALILDKTPPFCLCWRFMEHLVSLISCAQFVLEQKLKTHCCSAANRRNTSFFFFSLQSVSSDNQMQTKNRADCRLKSSYGCVFFPRIEAQES